MVTVSKVETGKLVRLDRMTPAERAYLRALPATSNEARSLLYRLDQVEATPPPLDFKPKTGRWPLLTWFTSQERILEREELAEILARLQSNRLRPTGGQ
jgi:hypothetical protein